jgi:hypothetical protein
MNPEMHPDSRMPVYPEPLMDKNENDPPVFDGDLTDFPLRMQTKLYNLWTLYSDLRRNTTLAKFLNSTDKKDDEERQYLRAITVITIDRLAKMLIETDLAQELTARGWYYNEPRKETQKEEGQCPPSSPEEEE